MNPEDPEDPDGPDDPEELADRLVPPATDWLGTALTRARLFARMFDRDERVELGRFDIVRRLGGGAMGAVYEAVDRISGARVAMKTLARDEPELAARLRVEFRTLSMIAHPNLVELYELDELDGRAYFTMELIDGAPIDVALRGAAPDAIRDAFAQLASALAHVHAAGYLHRDIKPANVLVETGGRVVLLDFGLVGRFATIESPRWIEIVGTPRYMAPEQLDGAPLDTAADWYGLGALLYEIVGGAPAFPDRDIVGLRAAKARALAALGGDLGALASALLDPLPAQRPGADDVLRALGVDVTSSSSHSIPLALVGRDDFLARFDAERREIGERTAVVEIVGASGMGKSAVLDALVARAHARGQPVLEGRCHERDGLPFRGLDGVVAELVRELGDIRDLGIPVDDLTAATTAFPALSRLLGAGTSAPSTIAIDPVEKQRRAITTLRTLLRSGARQWFIAIDDWQWADRDSVELLAALLAPPDPPMALWVLAARATDLPRAATTSRLRLELEPLSDEDAAALVRAVSRDPGAALPDARVHAIVREAAGCPLFLVEAGAGDSGGEALAFAALIRKRIAALDEHERALLHVVALAGVPLEPARASDIAGIDPSRQQVVVAKLRRARFLARREQGDARIEPYHHRIAAEVLGTCDSPMLGALHRRLAAGLAESEPATAAQHAWACGDSRLASTLAETGGRRAMQSLAFERAAELFGLARGWGDHTPLASAHLCARRGEALAAAGRAREAALAYLEATEGVGEPTRTEWRRRAAEEWLRSGHLIAGREVLALVLPTVGLRMPSSPRRSIVVERVRARWSSLTGTRRESAPASDRELAAIDVCWTAATGLGFVDLVTSAAFFARGARLAREHGDAARKGKWAAMDALQIALLGSRAATRARASIDAAAWLAKDEPVARALVRWAEGAWHHAAGRWQPAADACDEAVAMLRSHGQGAWWELTSAGILAESALYWLGRLDEVGRRVETGVAEAESRGDLLGVVTRRAGGLSAIGRLCADDPATARAESLAAIGKWEHAAVHVQHWYALQAEVQIGLYEHRGRALVDAVERVWPRLERSHLHRVQTLRIASHWRRGLAVVGAIHEDRGLTKIASAMIAKLDRERLPWSHALATGLRAGVSLALGQLDGAVTGLVAATDALAAAGMHALADAARRRLGETLGGNEGAAHVAAADSGLRAIGVRVPESFCRVFAPGGAPLA